MKKKFSAVGNNGEKKEKNQKEQQDFFGYGVAFLKTRAADYKIIEFQDALSEFGVNVGIELLDIIVDETASRDIDRDAVTDLCLWIENAPVSVLIVFTKQDITDDPDDLEKFLRNVNDRGIFVICLDEKIVYLPTDAEEDDETASDESNE